jgi:hypothetical protein
MRRAHLAEGCLALDLLALKHLPDLAGLLPALVAQLLLQLLVARNCFLYVKRDLLWGENRPTICGKETCYLRKRDLLYANF